MLSADPIVEPPILRSVVMHQQTHPASVCHLEGFFTGLGLADLNLGQTVHRFFSHGNSPEMAIGMGCKEKKHCGNFGCPWDGVGLLMNEKEE